MAFFFFFLLEVFCISNETTKCKCLHQTRENWEICAWISLLLQKTTFCGNCAHLHQLDWEGRHLFHRNCCFFSFCWLLGWIISKCWNLGRMTATFYKVWHIFGITETGWLLHNFRQPRVCICISVSWDSCFPVHFLETGW